MRRLQFRRCSKHLRLQDDHTAVYLRALRQFIWRLYRQVNVVVSCGDDDTTSSLVITVAPSCRCCWLSWDDRFFYHHESQATHCSYSGIVCHRQSGVQPRPQPMSVLTDFGLQPYVALVCHLMVFASSPPPVIHVVWTWITTHLPTQTHTV